jgi:hypothetical protein
MTRHHHHPKTQQLARMAVGGLRARRAARIHAHVAQCEQCARVCQELNAIRAILARATYPPMPGKFSARIESAISREAQRRLAATVVDRRDMPARRPRAGDGGGWHAPGLQASAARLAAAACAVVIAVGGSYLVAENVGTSVTRSPSLPFAGAVVPVQQLTPGPNVTYGRPGSLNTIRAVESHTNFVAAHLRTEAISAVRVAEGRAPFAAQPSAITTAMPAGSAADAIADGPSASRLAGCIGLISPGRTVLLIDIARYQGKPAAVIVTAAAVVSAAKAWVVGSSCSATTKDVLNQAALGNL